MQARAHRISAAGPDDVSGLLARGKAEAARNAEFRGGAIQCWVMVIFPLSDMITL